LAGRGERYRAGKAKSKNAWNPHKKLPLKYRFYAKWRIWPSKKGHFSAACITPARGSNDNIFSYKKYFLEPIRDHEIKIKIEPRTDVAASITIGHLFRNELITQTLHSMRVFESHGFFLVRTRKIKQIAS
jgi:hypothetical protein